VAGIKPIKYLFRHEADRHAAITEAYQFQGKGKYFLRYRFLKALARLHEQSLKVVEDEIEWVITSPEMGEFKKGALNYPRVHKFHLNNRLVLLGYCWGEDKLDLYLLSFWSHDNFYQEQKRQRKNDLRLVG
jgi:hypothetical protein